MQVYDRADRLSTSRLPTGRYPLNLVFTFSNISDQPIQFGEGDWLDNNRFRIEPSPPVSIEPGESITLNLFTNPVELEQANETRTILKASESDLELMIVTTTPRPLRMGLVGNGGLIRSDDYGKTFSEHIIQETAVETAKDIVWGNGRFLLASAASEATSATGVWRFSDDGINWVSSQTNAAFSATDCAFGLNRFACVREDVLSSSIDGTQIDHQPPRYEYKMNAIVALEDRFIAVGRGGRQAISFNGQDWDEESVSNEPDPYYDIATMGISWLPSVA